jgi:hypothetical protein
MPAGIGVCHPVDVLPINPTVCSALERYRCAGVLPARARTITRSHSRQPCLTPRHSKSPSAPVRPADACAGSVPFCALLAALIIRNASVQIHSRPKGGSFSLTDAYEASPGSRRRSRNDLSRFRTPVLQRPGTCTSTGIPCRVRMPARLSWRNSRALRQPEGGQPPVLYS